MTSPLPAQNSKPTLGESKNSQQGGFLNFCASPKSTETQSFESLISQNDQHHGGEDDPEEPIATKKEPKVLDAAAIAAQTLNNPPLQSQAELDLTADSLSQKTPDSETPPALGTSTKGDSNAKKITDTTGKNAQVEQNGALQSNGGNPAAQEAQNIPPEIKPSITSTIRLPKLKSGNTETPLPADDAQTKNIPTLPTAEKIQTSIGIPSPKSGNTDSAESTNPIAHSEDLHLAVGQMQNIPDFSAVSATAAQASQPSPTEIEKSNQQPSQQIPSPTLQAALASTILPTNFQTAGGEVVSDTGSSDAAPLEPASSANPEPTPKPASPTSKPTASAIPAAPQAPQPISSGVENNPIPSDGIPSPTLQAALASTILPTNFQTAGGEVVSDTGSSDAALLDPAPSTNPEPTPKPASPTSKPTASAIRAATEPPQPSSPETQDQEQATVQTDSKQPTDKIQTTENQKTSTVAQPTANTSVGMNHAVKQPKMISLATFDTIENASADSAQALSSLDVSSTSSNRLSPAKPFAASTAIPLPGSEKGADSAFAQLTSGNLPPTSPEIQTTPSDAASQAATVLKALPPELSKLQQSNPSNIQLDLPVGDNESVRIRLSLRGGEIHSTFITESAELRDALQKAWPDFTATHRTQGMRFADSQFQDGLRQQNDAASDQGRQRQYQQESSAQSSDHRQSIVKKTIPQPPTQTNRQGKLNLWA